MKTKESMVFQSAQRINVHRQCLLILLLILIPLSVCSETILIHSSSNSKGQGWLFGSPLDASCWIAVPKHVIETTRNGPPMNFRWIDFNGIEGLGINVVQPDKDLDLVFAEVQGRDKGHCLSRLGSSNISFQIDKQPVVEAMMMQTTHVEPRQMQIRDYNNELVRFVPNNPHARKEMKPGLSGAPMLLKTSNEIIPIGMIVTVDKSQDFGHAVRFDAIKSLFEGIKNTPKGFEIPANSSLPSESISFQLINSTGTSRDAESTAQSLLTNKGCWAVKPATNKRSLSVDVISNENIKPINFSKIKFSFDESCGELPDSIIIQKQHGTDWLTLSTCQTNQPQVTCNTLSQTFDKIRLVIIKRDGAQVGIGQISIL